LSAPETFKQGDNVHVTAFGRTVFAWVLLASGNSESLMLGFDAMLGGYIGSMPLIWNVDRFEDLFTGEAVTVEHALGNPND